MRLLTREAYTPEEQLSGYSTFVTDKSKSGLPGDIDREKEQVLPEGSATPSAPKKQESADGNGRQIGSPSYNGPASGEPGPAEHPRTVPTPGDEVPTKFDYGMPTRRTMTADEDHLAYEQRRPWEKEHRQPFQDRMEDKRYYRQNKSQIKRRVRLWYRKVRRNFQYKKLRDKRDDRPKKYERSKAVKMEKSGYSGWSPSKRRHKRMGPEHRERHRSYMHNRARSLRQHQRWYQRNHNKPAFRRRQKLRHDHPSRYRMRFGAYVPQDIFFFFGPAMTEGRVDSVSLDAVVFSPVDGGDPMNPYQMSPAAFLAAVVFSTPQDTMAMYEVLDDQVGHEAYADLTDEDVADVARLYGVHPPVLDSDDPDDQYEVAQGIVEDAMAQWDEMHGSVEKVADRYLHRMATGEVVLYDQRSPEDGSWERPDFGGDTPYEQSGPDQNRWSPGSKTPPGGSGGWPSVDTTGFGGGSGKVVPEHLKHGSCPLRTEMYGGLPEGGDFDRIKEIGAGLANTFDAAHCVLGSLGRQRDWASMVRVERGHLKEEVGIIVDAFHEYSNPVYVRQLFDFSDYRPEHRERAAESAQRQVDDLREKAPRLKALAASKRSALSREDLPPPVYDLAVATYRMVETLCDACLMAAQRWPEAFANPFQDREARKWVGEMKSSLAVLLSWDPTTFTSRVAKTIAEIESGLDRGVAERARSLDVRLARADQKRGIWMFKASGSKGNSYTIRVKAERKGNTKDVSKLQVKVSCDCEFFRWQGPEHWARSEGYLYGKPRGTASAPSEKDPSGKHRVCKHIAHVLLFARRYHIASSGGWWPAGAEIVLDDGSG